MISDYVPVPDYRRQSPEMMTDLVWVGECFFWYPPTRVVSDKGPLNGCVCVRILLY